MARSEESHQLPSHQTRAIDYLDVHHTRDDTLDKIVAQALKHNTAIYTLFAYFATASGVDFRE